MGRLETLGRRLCHKLHNHEKIETSSDTFPVKFDPDSANGRASASGAGGRGFDPGPRHTKGVKNGTSGYLAWRSAL